MRRLIPIAIALSLFAAGCGDDEEKESAASSPAATATEEATPETAPEPEGDIKDLETKPGITVPEGDPPTKLVKEDIVKGKGKVAKKGKTISVQYVGVSYTTKEEFDASWNRGQPFEFQLGGGQVIPGWDEGFTGMRVGGRRRLTIPPDMAYGPQGRPPAIAPNDTLIFVVDLIDVQ